MDAKVIVRKLRSLASDPENRETIVKDQGCLPGLILFLDHDDPEVITLSLEALEFLSICHSNKAVMFEELGLLDSIERIIREQGESKDKEIATRLKKNLHQARPRDPSNKWNQDISKNSIGGTGQSFFKGQANRKAKTVVFQLETTKNAPIDRSIVEETLLEAKGVISFTFDIDLSRVAVRYRNDLPPDRLFKKLATLRGMKAKQVIRSASGDEIFIDLFDKKENEGRINREPAYLDDEEDADPTVDKKHKAISTPFRDSKGRKKEGGWFSSLGGMISKAFW